MHCSAIQVFAACTTNMAKSGRDGSCVDEKTFPQAL
jgi:hypothetical protein